MLALIAAPARAASPSPGAVGLGDRLFPQLGNGGYDALHYDLDLRYATSTPTQPIDGTVTMRGRATQALSRFDLDFAGQSVGSVAVDGQRAAWRRDGEELVITPRTPLRAGDQFQVTVSHFTAVPTEANSDNAATQAFFFHPTGSATAGQPNWAHYFLPSNDHPRDKATFDIRFDVPAGQTAVANGVLSARRTDGGREHFVYAQRQPMATELISSPWVSTTSRRTASIPACSCAMSRRNRSRRRSRRSSPSRRARSTGCRRASGPTRSTSTARWWWRPTSASRSRPRRWR